MYVYGICQTVRYVQWHIYDSQVYVRQSGIYIYIYIYIDR